MPGENKMRNQIRKPYAEKNGVYITKKGEWGISYIDCNGKKKREKAGTYEDAIKLRKIRIAEVAEGKKKGKCSYDKKLFKDALPIFIENHVNNLKSKASTMSMLNKIVANFNNMKLCDISTLEVTKFYHNIGNPDSYSYANRILSILSKFFSCMINWNLFSGENPCLKVDKKPDEYFEPTILTEEEIAQFIATVADYIRPCVIFAFYLGLRRQELLNLRWEYINMEYNTITIPKTKTDESRTLGLSEDLKMVLNSIGPKKEGNVFSITQAQLRSQFDITSKKLCLKHVRPHDGRHNFAVTFLNRGGRIEILQRLLGHASLKTTQKYLRFKKNEIASKMLVMDGLIPQNILTNVPNVVSNMATNATNPNV